MGRSVPVRVPRDKPDRGQLRPEAITQFRRIVEVEDVADAVLARVRELDEETEIEPHLMKIVHGDDPADSSLPARSPALSPAQ